MWRKIPVSIIFCLQVFASSYLRSGSVSELANSRIRNTFDLSIDKHFFRSFFKNKKDSLERQEICTVCCMLGSHNETWNFAGSVLEGLSKFAHVINLEFFSDLIAAFQTLLASDFLQHRWGKSWLLFIARVRESWLFSTALVREKLAFS